MLGFMELTQFRLTCLAGNRIGMVTSMRQIGLIVELSAIVLIVGMRQCCLRFNRNRELQGSFT